MSYCYYFLVPPKQVIQVQLVTHNRCSHNTLSVLSIKKVWMAARAKPMNASAKSNRVKVSSPKEHGCPEIASAQLQKNAMSLYFLQICYLYAHENFGTALLIRSNARKRTTKKIKAKNQTNTAITSRCQHPASIPSSKYEHKIPFLYSGFSVVSRLLPVT